MSDFKEYINDVIVNCDKIISACDKLRYDCNEEKAQVSPCTQIVELSNFDITENTNHLKEIFNSKYGRFGYEYESFLNKTKYLESINKLPSIIIYKHADKIKTCNKYIIVCVECGKNEYVDILRKKREIIHEDFLLLSQPYKTFAEELKCEFQQIKFAYNKQYIDSFLSK